MFCLKRMSCYDRPVLRSLRHRKTGHRRLLCKAVQTSIGLPMRRPWLPNRRAVLLLLLIVAVAAHMPVALACPAMSGMAPGGPCCPAQPVQCPGGQRAWAAPAAHVNAMSCPISHCLLHAPMGTASVLALRQLQHVQPPLVRGVAWLIPLVVAHAIQPPQGPPAAAAVLIIGRHAYLTTRRLRI